MLSPAQVSDCPEECRPAPCKQGRCLQHKGDNKKHILSLTYRLNIERPNRFERLHYKFKCDTFIRESKNDPVFIFCDKKCQDKY